MRRIRIRVHGSHELRKAIFSRLINLGYGQSDSWDLNARHYVDNEWLFTDEKGVIHTTNGSHYEDDEIGLDELFTMRPEKPKVTKLTAQQIRDKFDLEGDVEIDGVKI
jgi:hypothetical protein